MIVPYLNGVLSFLKAPVTWLLIALNIVCFFAFQGAQESGQSGVEALLEDDFFVRAQGQIYSQYVIENSNLYSDYMIDIAALTSVGRFDKMELMGHLAFRDQGFLTAAQDFEERGDIVEFRYWKEKSALFIQEQAKNPNYIYGLTSGKSKTYRLLSYQFIHGGLWHLIFNMWFLLVFGCFLEPLIGRLEFLGVYLFAGVAAALTFSYLSGFSSLPLVGASGAINGLMGLFAYLNFFGPIRFMFWILPIKGYWGFVSLPAWVAMGVWFLLDISGYLGTLAEFGGVAHSAHLGGAAVGFLLGALFFRSKKLPVPKTPVFEHGVDSI